MGDRLVRWHTVAQGIDGEMKRNQTQSWVRASSSRTPGLRAVAAWTQGHRHRTTLSSAPTAGVCSPALSRPLETRHNSAAGSDPPKTPNQQTAPSGGRSPIRMTLQIGSGLTISTGLVPLGRPSAEISAPGGQEAGPQWVRSNKGP
jgi:hypothetical protein